LALVVPSPHLLQRFEITHKFPRSIVWAFLFILLHLNTQMTGVTGLPY
jgi:hypothetical protein